MRNVKITGVSNFDHMEAREMTDTLINKPDTNSKVTVSPSSPQTMNRTPVVHPKTAAPASSTTLRKRGLRQILAGTALIIVGVVVTAVTYHAASDSASGGTYLV